jgi:PAS domain S-box-containing protein
VSQTAVLTAGLLTCLASLVASLWRSARLSARLRVREAALATALERAEALSHSLEDSREARLRDAHEARLRDALRTVAEAVSAETGEAFFRSFTAALTETLGVAHAFVGELADAEGRSVRTLAFRCDGESRPSFVYDLHGAPCEQVVGRSLCVFPDSVQELFPKDLGLRRIGAVSYMGAPLFDVSGRPLGLLAVMDRKPLTDTDLLEPILRIFASRAAAELERKQALEELRASEQKFSRAFRFSPDAVLITSIPDGRLLEVNEGFLALTGHERTSVLGATTLELGLWADPREREELFAELAAQEAVRDKRCRFRTKGGAELACLVSAQRFDLHGVPHLLSVARDVTERERLERERARQERLKDEFVAMAAHELKTPLTILKGYAQVLGDAPDAEPAERRAICTALSRGADRIDRVVGDLLEVTRLQIGRYELRRRSFDLRALVVELVRDQQALAPRHSIELDAGSPLPVLGDRARVGQALMNLLGNAVKHSPHGGLITVRAARADSRAVISVADSGVGIPRDRQAGIFERFYRAHAGTPHDYGGLGVGLYLSREIVRRHAGEIWFESEEGRGSTFHLALPLEQA